MTRRRMIFALALALLALVLTLGSCGGDQGKTTSPSPSPARSNGTPPLSLNAFPPAFVECLRDQGIDVEALDSEAALSDAIHSPQGGACFEALHGG
jgi:hypothetical protein